MTPQFSTPEQRRWARSIKEARTNLGLTQNQAAELLGVAQSTFCDWERAKRVPSEDLRGVVVQRLGINPRDVLPGWAA